MSWSAVVGSVQGTGQLVAKTVTINSGSSNLLVVLVGCYGGAPGPVLADLADTQSNVYTLVTPQVAAGDANLNLGIYYKISPTNSGTLGVTFTPAGGGYPGMIVYAFTQGSAPSFRTNVQTGTNSSGTVTPGSIGLANDLVVEGISFYTVGGHSLSGSFSTVTEIAYNAGNSMGCAAAWKEIASAVSPVWTTDGSNVVAAQAVAFTGVGGGGGGGKPFTYYQRMQLANYRREQAARERLIDRASRETILRRAA
jgi:hypothetical protein